jgi:hypothetical protein
MLGWLAHYKNKYPNGRVLSSDSALDVYNEEGEHVVALRKNGAGQWMCESEALGLADRHDLSPIPKDSRVHKVVDGKLGYDEHAKERKEKREHFRGECGKVLSVEELKKHGFKFDEGHRVVEFPQKKIEA